MKSDNAKVVYLLLVLLIVIIFVAQVDGLQKCYKEDPSKRTYNHDGLQCLLCPPGHIKRKECTSFMETRCTQCPPNSYMPHYNECEECKLCTERCSGLNQIVVQECNSTHPRVCGCLEGTYPSADNTQCFGHRCPPGERVFKRGKRRPSFVCRMCLPHTYSSTPNRWTSCLPHTNCTAEGRVFQWHGNATHDAVCQNNTSNLNSSSPSTVSVDTTAKTAQSPSTPQSPQAEAESTSQPPTTQQVNRIQPSPSYPSKPRHGSDGSNGLTDPEIIGMIFGVIFGVILIIAVPCVWYLCCKKRRNGRRTCGIPMKEKRKLATTVSNSKQNLVGNMKENSRDSSPLLKKNISLRQDKTPENFMDGIASEWDKKINWKKFLRKTPAPSLTEIEISDVEHNCGRQADIYEKIFQCLLIWYKKQSHDVFPLKELLQVLYELDKPLVRRLLEKYCMCEDTAN